MPKKELVLMFLNLIREFTTTPANTPALVQAEIMSTITNLMAVTPSTKDAILGIAVDILWNCLDASAVALRSAPPAPNRAAYIKTYRESNAIYRLSYENALWVLKDLSLHLLEGGYRSVDKELRNAVMIILSFVSRWV